MAVHKDCYSAIDLPNKAALTGGRRRFGGVLAIAVFFSCSVAKAS